MDNKKLNPNIYLIGLMGAGKTSIGRCLAKKLKRPFHDSDQAVEAHTGADITWIFDVEGEDGFRDREVAAIDTLTQTSNIVLSTGGGAVLREENRKHLSERGIVIYLEASIDTLVRRTRYCGKRPLLQKRDRREVFEELINERGHFYRDIANMTYRTDRGPLPILCNKIARDLKKRGIQ